MTEDSQNKQFPCNDCDKSFTRNYELQQHKDFAHQQDSIPKFQCVVCSKIFEKKDSFTKHKRTHTNERPYKCKLCDKSFHQSAHLKYHERIHSDFKAFSCSICEKPFRRKTHLRLHERTHSDERPFKCDICDRAYFSSSALKIHVQTHSSKKPYSCKMCDKSFTQEVSLTDHQFLHTGRKCFQCEICTLSFRQRSSLYRHLRKSQNCLGEYPKNGRGGLLITPMSIQNTVIAKNSDDKECSKSSEPNRDFMDQNEDSSRVEQSSIDKSDIMNFTTSSVEYVNDAPRASIADPLEEVEVTKTEMDDKHILLEEERCITENVSGDFEETIDVEEHCIKDEKCDDTLVEFAEGREAVQFIAVAEVAKKEELEEVEIKQNDDADILNEDIIEENVNNEVGGNRGLVLENVSVDEALVFFS